MKLRFLVPTYSKQEIAAPATSWVKLLKKIFGTASLKALREGATNDPNKEKEQTNALSSFCQLRALISLLIS